LFGAIKGDNCKYEGHPINKLLNGVILLIFRIYECIVTVILLDRQCMFGVKSLLRVEKVLLGRNDLAAVLF